MNKLLKNTILTSTLVATFSGCAMDEFARKYSPEGVTQMLKDKMSGRSADNLLKDFEEPILAKPFVKFYDMPRHSLKYHKTTITVTNQWVHFSENVYMNRVNSYIVDHSADNEFAKLYKEAIKKRGNEYRKFTAPFNQKVVEKIYGRAVPTFDNDRDLKLIWNKIPMLAEFSKEGELLSVMIFKVEVGAAFNKFSNQNVQSEIILNAIIAVGSSLNSIKNSISKKEWEANQL